ncbi:hypothetical protein MPD5_1668 (plasmid) [Melissococcus plutonius DAT561]|uniref:Uncharacterized protein n=1 Tax=Melissococcus plutonius TaxID=33970 RepID=A0A2Z5Y4Z2_9ENTE|nr:hypothetical protein MPD5_1668 [Melissococcus plutonius DAT561]BBC61833.1 hypothetical protein DAT561_p1133 [Melissococcus plutonius]
MKVIITIIYLIYGFISFVFFITNMIRLFLSRKKNRKTFAKYYSLTSIVEVKQKQKEIEYFFLEQSSKLKKNYLLAKFIYLIMCLTLLLETLFSLLTLILNLNFMFTLFIALLAFLTMTLYIVLTKKISQLSYSLIKENDSIKLKESNTFLVPSSDLAFDKEQHNYNLLILSLILFIIYIIMSIIIFINYY